VAILVDQHILRLDVSMDDSVSVHFFDCEEQFSKVNPSVILRQPAIWLLVYHVPHVSRGAVIRHHVEILECLKGVVELGHELMVDFTLNFFLCYDEAGKTIIRLLLHSLHGVKLACALPFIDETLNKVDFSVGTRA
jgi:hypothetical protein